MVALASLLILNIFVTFPAQAGIVNGSFEDGLNGWSPNDPNRLEFGFIIVTSDSAVAPGGIPVVPTDEVSHVFFTSGFEVTSIEQEITFQSTGILSFDAGAMSYNEIFLGNHDYFAIALGEDVIYSRTVESLGETGSDFSHITYEVTDVGTRLLRIGIYSVGDLSMTPLYGFTDNYRFTPSEVPIPPGAALFISALFSLGAMTRRKK